MFNFYQLFVQFLSTFLNIIGRVNITESDFTFRGYFLGKSAMERKTGKVISTCGQTYKIRFTAEYSRKQTVPLTP